MHGLNLQSLIEYSKQSTAWEPDKQKLLLRLKEDLEAEPLQGHYDIACQGDPNPCEDRETAELPEPVWLLLPSVPGGGEGKLFVIYSGKVNRYPEQKREYQVVEYQQKTDPEAIDLAYLLETLRDKVALDLVGEETLQDIIILDSHELKRFWRLMQLNGPICPPDQGVDESGTLFLDFREKVLNERPRVRWLLSHPSENSLVILAGMYSQVFPGLITLGSLHEGIAASDDIVDADVRRLLQKIVRVLRSDSIPVSLPLAVHTGDQDLTSEDFLKSLRAVIQVKVETQGFTGPVPYRSRVQCGQVVLFPEIPRVALDSGRLVLTINPDFGWEILDDSGSPTLERELELGSFLEKNEARLARPKLEVELVEPSPAVPSDGRVIKTSSPWFHVMILPEAAGKLDFKSIRARHQQYAASSTHSPEWALIFSDPSAYLRSWGSHSIKRVMGMSAEEIGRVPAVLGKINHALEEITATAGVMHVNEHRRILLMFRGPRRSSALGRAFRAPFASEVAFYAMEYLVARKPWLKDCVDIESSVIEGNDFGNELKLEVVLVPLGEVVPTEACSAALAGVSRGRSQGPAPKVSGSERE